MKTLKKETALNLENMMLSCCELIKKHTNEIRRIVDKAKKNRKIIDIQEFRAKPICLIKRSDDDVPMNLNVIEENYVKDFPGWNKKKFQSFPEGPLFYDRLFKSEPSKRAVDIEKRLKELRKKVNIISEAPFDIEKDSDDSFVITKTADAINESLKVVITELNLASNQRVMDIPNLVKGMIKGKLGSLKDAAKSLETINQVQNDAFDKVLENHKTITEEKGFFKMRIGDMGEFSAVKAIKSILTETPSFCVRGLKIA